jgi:hypothetical protein
MSDASAWGDFYITAGAAAAVLIGLLFVALSINRDKIAPHPRLGGQAMQMIFALVSVFVVSLLVLVPNQSTTALGVELIVGASFVLARAIPRQVRRMRTTIPIERRGFALLVAVFDAAMLLIFAAGVTLVAGGDFAFKLLAAAVIALALLSVFNSWALTLVGTDP